MLIGRFLVSREVNQWRNFSISVVNCLLNICTSYISIISIPACLARIRTWTASWRILIVSIILCNTFSIGTIQRTVVDFAWKLLWCFIFRILCISVTDWLFLKNVLLSVGSLVYLSVSFFCVFACVRVKSYISHGFSMSWLHYQEVTASLSVKCCHASYTFGRWLFIRFFATGGAVYIVEFLQFLSPMHTGTWLN